MTVVLVEPQIIALLKRVFPTWRVQLAPDQVSGAGSPLVTVQATNLPVEGTLGRASIIDVEVFHTRRDTAMKIAQQALDTLENAAVEGTLSGVAHMMVLTLPSLVRNPTDAHAMKVAAFSVKTVGHYRTH